MSMIEKFLENKNALRKGVEEIREAAIKAVNEKTDEMIDNFVGNFKEMLAEASDAEFAAFITSGKLDDEDIVAAIAFRAEVKDSSSNNVSKSEEPREKHGHRVRVFVLN